MLARFLLSAVLLTAGAVTANAQTETLPFATDGYLFTLPSSNTLTGSSSASSVALTAGVTQLVTIQNLTYTATNFNANDNATLNWSLTIGGVTHTFGQPVNEFIPVPNTEVLVLNGTGPTSFDLGSLGIVDVSLQGQGIGVNRNVSRAVRQNRKVYFV